MDGINQMLVPLYGSPVYRDKLVLLCDKPSENRAKDFDKFCNAYQALIDSKQMHILTVEAIEIYYPDQWKKNPEQVKAMQSREKTALAEIVGCEITKDQFEKEMPIVFSALNAAWDLAY